MKALSHFALDSAAILLLEKLMDENRKCDQSHNMTGTQGGRRKTKAFPSLV
jgi:hypothetical protein